MSSMSSTLDLTQDLLRRPSVSPEDHGCIDAICRRLEPLGFRIERLPFGPVVEDGVLYARGAADMKSSLAAMVTAAERFLQRNPRHHGSLAFLFTSDEEGPSVDGTRKVMEVLQARHDRIDWC